MKYFKILLIIERIFQAIILIFIKHSMKKIVFHAKVKLHYKMFLFISEVVNLDRKFHILYSLFLFTEKILKQKLNN